MPKLCRAAFGDVVGRCHELMRYIAEQGPSAVLDVDDLLLRESMDVIGESQSLCSVHLPLTVCCSKTHALEGHA